MHFATSALALIASAAYASAGTITFKSLDDKTRTVYFTGNPGHDDVGPFTVNGGEDKTVEVPQGYVGNFYAVQEGAENKPGMLGEVSFSSWSGLTFFDVSAIVDPTDSDNVKQMWPANSESPMSGCEVFPCDNAYWHPDDIQTKVTEETHLITTLGGSS